MRNSLPICGKTHVVGAEKFGPVTALGTFLLCCSPICGIGGATKEAWVYFWSPPPPLPSPGMTRCTDSSFFPPRAIVIYILFSPLFGSERDREDQAGKKTPWYRLCQRKEMCKDKRNQIVIPISWWFSNRLFQCALDPKNAQWGVRYLWQSPQYKKATLTEQMSCHIRILAIYFFHATQGKKTALLSRFLWNKFSCTNFYLFDFKSLAVFFWYHRSPR